MPLSHTFQEREPHAIDSREEIYQALLQASHLEHGLSLLYMYAAFSLRKNTTDYPDYDSVDPETRKLYQLTMNQVRLWEKQLLHISRQEMEHLGIVQNLLGAIGEKPYFSRPNFPISADAHEIDIPYHLSRFNSLTLKRFLEFEKPDYLDSILKTEDKLDCRSGGPAEPNSKCECHFFGNTVDETYPSVESLYEAVLKAFQTLPPGEVFIGDSKYQITSAATNLEGKVFMKPVYNRATASEAIGLILEQGEGVGLVPLSDDSHYERFAEVFTEYQAFWKAHPDLDAALPVLCNPMIEYPNIQLDPAVTNLVTAEPAQTLIRLFNKGYFLMTSMLKGFFEGYMGFFGNYPTFPHIRQNQALYQAAFFPFMTMFIRPLGELIMRIPAGPEYPGKTAGPSFQLEPNSEGKVIIPGIQPLEFYVALFDELLELTTIAQSMETASDYLSMEAYAEQLNYLFENLSRMKLNFVNDWEKGDVVQ